MQIHEQRWPMSALERWSQPVDATLYLKEEMECMVMSQRFHRGFTAAEKTELWDRWKRGESLKAIGRAFGKPSSSIYFLVAPHGGIRPALRRRSRLALTLPEREEISRGITAHQSARSMATRQTKSFVGITSLGSQATLTFPDIARLGPARERPPAGGWGL